MKKLISLFILILSLFSFNIASQTFACSCAMPESPEIEIGKADYVFIWTVNTIDQVTFIEEFLPGEKIERINKKIKFSDTINIKWFTSNWITISTPQHGWTCGINFQQDKEYIVYAYKGNNNEINTWSCSRTNQTEYAQDDLIAFKEIIELNKNSQLPVDYSPTNYFAIIWSLTVLLIWLTFGIYQLSKQKDTD